MIHRRVEEQAAACLSSESHHVAWEVEETEETVEEKSDGSLSPISMCALVGNTGNGKQQGLLNLYCEMG